MGASSVSYKSAVSCKAAVLGHPIAHSLSPVLHRAALRELGLDVDYSAIDVTEDALPSFVESLDASWVGLSLTMPLKTKIIEIVPSHDDLVELTQSANTVFRLSDGEFSLTNTDVFGIEKAVRESGLDHADRVLILGSGATARSAVVAARNLGAEKITVQARNEQAINQILSLISRLGISASSGEIDTSQTEDYDLVISTLPPLVPELESAAISRETTAVLLDVTYSPWPTALARLWPTSKVISGKEMLLWQATRQCELFYGNPAPVAAMRESLSLA